MTSLPPSQQPPLPASPLVERRHELLPFAVIGLACVIAGGLLAAVTASAPSEHTTWAAAYLVLVGGVAQAGLGLAQTLFTVRTSALLVAAEVVGWNLGNAAVLTGTLLDSTALVDLGGVLLAVTLVMYARGLRGTGERPIDGVRRWGLHAYRLLIVILFVSIPIGLLLARTGS